MPDLLRERRPKARTEHRCSCCTGPIPAGTTYSRDTLAYDGRVYDWLTCEGCEGLVNEVYAWLGYSADDGIGLDDYIEWAEAHVDDPKHGEAARALLARAGQAVA